MSSAFFDGVMQAERMALVAEQRLAGAPCFSAVGDIGIVRDQPSPVRRRHPVNLEALGETSFIQACPTLGYRFLWVHVENDRYRRDYEQHLARSFGAAAPAIPGELHVDHLYNRERARVFKLNYVRMVLLPRGINTSHGAGYERLRTRGIGADERTRSIDTVMLMKLFGFRSPPSDGRITPDIRRFCTLLEGLLGEAPGTLHGEVANLMELARFRPS